MNSWDWRIENPPKSRICSKTDPSLTTETQRTQRILTQMSTDSLKMMWRATKCLVQAELVHPFLSPHNLPTLPHCQLRCAKSLSASADCASFSLLAPRAPALACSAGVLSSTENQSFFCLRCPRSGINNAEALGICGEQEMTVTSLLVRAFGDTRSNLELSSVNSVSLW